MTFRLSQNILRGEIIWFLPCFGIPHTNPFTIVCWLNVNVRIVIIGHYSIRWVFRKTHARISRKSSIFPMVVSGRKACQPHGKREAQSERADSHSISGMAGAKTARNAISPRMICSIVALPPTFLKRFVSAIPIIAAIKSLPSSPRRNAAVKARRSVL